MRDIEGLHPLPSLVRDLDWLQDAAWNRKLTRRERRWLLELERRCSRVRWPLPLMGSRNAFALVLPGSRRVRAIDRIGRVRAVVVARAELVSALVRRVRALMPPLEPEPVHGPKCTSGCRDCAAIWRWRSTYEVLSGADAITRRYLFP